VSTKRKKKQIKNGKNTGVPPTWQLSTLQPDKLLVKLKEEAEGKHGEKGTQEKFDDSQSGALYKAARFGVVWSRVALDVAFWLGMLALFVSVCVTCASLMLYFVGFVFAWEELTRAAWFFFEISVFFSKILAVLLLANKANEFSLWLCVGGEEAGDNWHHLLYNALYDKPIDEQEQWQKKQDGWSVAY
jgi:hypothetical protein